ncbi:MAG: pyridoxal phosphate-dependent aminotransferase [Gammaproteobacteria bacterium]|nr:pyridoxal phosphate-dependent aminotransferase [Gammaproteobacteria bacterium]MBI5618408.1 pyridoxal phosphate-dependent aminotransferase [Gammaproteobacteria bacterium]
MDFRPSHRAQTIKSSPIFSISAKAAALRAEGRDVIDLSAGEPDFDTPAHIKAAAIEAINAGFTKYTPVDGTPELKRAVIDKFARENSLSYTGEQILVSCGCKHSIYNLMQAMLDPGDEVIIPAPYWVSYPDMVRLADAAPVIIKTDVERAFKIAPEQLRGVLGEKTRMIVFNSPGNPSGASYTPAEYKALGAVLAEFPDVIVVSDDIYEHIQWTGRPFGNILNAVPALHNRTVVVNGVSKAYAMTGWRIGYAAGPQKIIQAMHKIQSQSTSNAASIAQVAATAALNGDQSVLAKHCQAFKERHDYVLTRLRALPGVDVVPADGTFYAFPDMGEFIQRRKDLGNDVKLADHLLERANVAVVPGSAFGAPGCIRLSYATGLETLEKALDRIAAALT